MLDCFKIKTSVHQKSSLGKQIGKPKTGRKYLQKNMTGEEFLSGIYTE